MREIPIPIIGIKQRYLKKFLLFRKIKYQKTVATCTSPLGKPNGSWTGIRCSSESGRGI
jgi:hypothetical protein